MKNAIVLTIFAFLILFLSLHRGDLSGYDDALYAHEAKQMIRTGDWWNVRFNDRLNFEYPPMFLWIEALSMKVWGFTDFAAKFPVALLGVATIVLTYLLVLELTADAWLAALSMLVLMSTQYFIKYSMHAMTDVPCAFFFLLSIYGFVKGLRRPPYFLLCGIAVGLTILTRSVVGLLPLAIFLLIPLLERRAVGAAGADGEGEVAHTAKLPFILLGLILAIGIPSIWYLSQYHLHGATFISGHIRFTETKLLGGLSTRTQRLFSLLQYLKLFLRGYWPWLPFLALGLIKQTRRSIARDSFALLLTLWVVCIVVPFSLAQVKILRYLMPAFPAFSIIAATSLNDWIPIHRRQLFLKWVYAFGIAAVVYVLFFPFLLPRAGDMQQLAPIAQANCPQDQNIILYTWGRVDYNYNNQLLWYGNRFTELPAVLEGVKVDFELGNHTVAIMDRDSYRGFPERLGPGFDVQVLGESEQFICFKAVRRSG
jgi:4-amino-4-deoxy-L-arabinose transferase-like glycosyltransferase